LERRLCLPKPPTGGEGRGGPRQRRGTGWLIKYVNGNRFLLSLSFQIPPNVYFMKTLSIIIPVYNEERTIDKILDRVKKAELIEKIEKEIIVVNDCSTDDTGKIVLNYIEKNRDLVIKYFKHEKNIGKGASIRTGIRKASGKYLIIQDADLEYEPNEYNILLKPVLEDFADVVYGSRFVGGKPHRVLFFWH